MKKTLFLFVLFLLTGCFFSTKNSTFYLLESTASEAFSQKKLSIAVSDVIIPDYLQKPQIVLQQTDSPELKISEFNRWASDLEGMVQNTLIENLAKLLPNASVNPLMYGGNAQYVVKTEIEKMSGYLGQDAVLKGNVQIISVYGKILKKFDFDLKKQCGKTYASYVKTQSELIEELALKIVSNI